MVWFSGEAIADWSADPRMARGDQPHYSAIAIRAALALREVFLLALRQPEGLIGSILKPRVLILPCRIIQPGAVGQKLWMS